MYYHIGEISLVFPGFFLFSFLHGKEIEMSPETSEQTCRENELHAGHMCELESQQEWDTIRLVSDNPRVRCENCGAEANSARNVCMPTEL